MYTFIKHHEYTVSQKSQEQGQGFRKEHDIMISHTSNVPKIRLTLSHDSC